MAIYVVEFRSSGVPQSGLTPTIIAYRYLDGTSPGTPPVLTEIDPTNAPGCYKFTANPTQEIWVEVDGGATLTNANERYQSAVISPQDTAVLEAYGNVQINQDWGTPGALRAQDPQGHPLQGVTILLYRQADYLASRLSAEYTVGQTISDVNGNWVEPISASSGQTYVVLFQLPNYGNSTVTITT